MYHFLTCFLVASFSRFLVSLACEGIQNGCPNRSGNHENGVLPAVPAERQERDTFLILFCMFFHLFSIDFCDVLDVGFEDIQSIPAKRPYQNHTGKHRVLHQKQHFRKNDIDTNKARKMLKTMSKTGLETRRGKTFTRDQFSFHFGLKNHPK